MLQPVAPSNGKTEVERDTDLRANFSEGMDCTTLTTSTFKLYKVLRNADGTTTTQQVTNTTVQWLYSSGEFDCNYASLNPYGNSSRLLAANTRYKAVITTGAKDLSGNRLDQNPAKVGNQPKVWTFTTGSS